ncbi:minor capsid protein [Methanocaldococcus fervens]|nr:minor capsid protein [Methanocaldococcus fervens]ACV25344.1 phage head morphogenesis protein, SPP1 gp7 family [Methanocaldococcus fervens AG86]
MSFEFLLSDKDGLLPPIGEENKVVDLAKDYAVNMAIRVLLTQIFTEFSVEGSNNKIKNKVADLIEEKLEDIKLAFIDYLLKGKCILYQLNRINPDTAIVRTNGKDYYVEYTADIPAGEWWNGEVEAKKIVIAPKEIWDKIDADEIYDSRYLSVFYNSIPSHETVEKIVKIKEQILYTISPMMVQRALIPLVIGKSDEKKVLEYLKKAFANWQNHTRIVVPSTNAVIETISIGKEIPTDLIELLLYQYDSSIFMALGTSISTVKASGQELTTSRTIDRNLLRIVLGYQKEVETWIYEQLQKMGYKNVWIKFKNPDPEFDTMQLQKIQAVAQLKQVEAVTGQDMSAYIERIFPSNEYENEIMASTIDLTEKEVERLLKKAKPLKEGLVETIDSGLYYITDEKKLQELEKEREKLRKVMEYLAKKGDKFGKESIKKFINFIMQYPNFDDNLLSQFAREEVDRFIIDYVIPAMNALHVYDDLPADILTQLKPIWEQAFKNIYSSYSQQVLDVLNDGIRKGYGEEKLKKELEKVIGNIKGQRLQQRARQELTKTYNTARAARWWNDKVVYITMKDDRVRPAHRKLHGLVFVPAEHPELVPPLGYNCRCTITPYRGD